MFIVNLLFMFEICSDLFENLYVQVIGFILIIGLLIFSLKMYLMKKMQHGIFLCVEYFIRNCHDVAFYNPQKHCRFYEYEKLFQFVKKNQSAWYINKAGRSFAFSFLMWYDTVDNFIHRMSSFMHDEHYFAYSEFQECIRNVNIYKVTQQFLTEDFLIYVNKKVSESFISIEKYESELKFGFSDIVQKHNNMFVKNELINNKDFFDTVLKYPLDIQQRESIVKLEDNCLVVSSAGSGKTSTSVGKIKYLVEKRHIAPEKILSLTYTTKAARELTSRLDLSSKGLQCHTFHSLAFKILAETTKEKPAICDNAFMLQCFYSLIDKNAAFKSAINTFLTSKESLTKNMHDYMTSDAYFADRALYGIQAPFLDKDGKIIFTRSEEEKKICTFLSMNNVSFRYEYPYLYKTATEFKRQYLPDFTIYFYYKGKEYFIILEHFGIDKNGNVPSWFGVGHEDGYERANAEYNDGIRWKRQIHSHYKTTMIETTSAMFKDGTIYDELTRQLRQCHVPMRQLSEEEKFERLVRRNKKMEDSILQLITNFITLMKSNGSSIDSIYNIIKEERKQYPLFIERSKFILYEIFKPIYEEYQQLLIQRKQIDYTDLILKATKICEEGLYEKEYDMILVDEFQDISVDRFRLLQALRRKSPLTKLYCVGDDWQSIFRFSGSDLSLFNSFEKYFGYTEKCKIETTYRFGNPTVKLSTQFILKNEAQVCKEIHPRNESIHTYLTLSEYGKEEGCQYNVLKLLISKIPQNESVMLIGRYNSDVSFIPKTQVFERNSQGYISKVLIMGREIPYNTVHSAKGLEADNVILVNCSQDGNGFPSKISDDPILGYVLSKPETYPFAEERRLFYVAITRAKKHTYIMYKETCPSSFVHELSQAMSQDAPQKNILKCPRCRNGNLRVVNEYDNGNNRKNRCYRCTNNMAGCDYSWTVYYYDEDNIEKQFNQVVKKSKLVISVDNIEKLKLENPNADFLPAPASCAPQPCKPIECYQDESGDDYTDGLPF